LSVARTWTIHRFEGGLNESFSLCTPFYSTRRKSLEAFTWWKEYESRYVFVLWLARAKNINDVISCDICTLSSLLFLLTTVAIFFNKSLRKTSFIQLTWKEFVQRQDKDRLSLILYSIGVLEQEWSILFSR